MVCMMWIDISLFYLEIVTEDISKQGAVIYERRVAPNQEFVEVEIRSPEPESLWELEEQCIRSMAREGSKVGGKREEDQECEEEYIEDLGRIERRYMEIARLHETMDGSNIGERICDLLKGPDAEEGDQFFFDFVL